jgi:hypothetical protein
VKYNVVVLFYFYFYLSFIIFLGSRTARTKRPIFMVDGSKRVFCRKEVPFGVSKKIEQIWGRGSLKTPNFRPRNANSPLK